MTFTVIEQIANIIMDHADNSMDYGDALMAAQDITTAFLIPKEDH